MEKVFLINRTKFICSMVEFALKSEGIATYTLPSTEKCHYIIEDIEPDILVVDLKTLQLSDDPHFFEGISSNQKLASIPLVGMGDEQDISDTKNSHLAKYFKGYIGGPISPIEIGDQIRSLLSN